MTVTQGTKTFVTDDAPQAQINTPVKKSTIRKEQAAIVETPIGKEDTLRPIIPTEQEKATSRPKTDVHAEQSKLAISSVTEPMKDVKQTMGPEKTISPEGIPSFPYSILLSHCRDVRNAEEVMFQFAQRDLVPYWVKVEVSNGVWYRVFVGSFKERIEAETFKQEYGLKEGIIMNTVYANLIGVYASTEELQQKRRSLIEIGYSPYVIKNQDGGSRLLIGAFLTKEGAESQYQELKTSGIESRVIKR